jgi:hypothetical protein
MKDRKARSLTEVLAVMAIIAALMAMVVHVALTAWRQAKAFLGPLWPSAAYKQVGCPRAKDWARAVRDARMVCRIGHGPMLDEAGGCGISRLAGLDAGT